MASVPLSISVAASLEKSKLASTDAWLALVKITWPDNSVLRLVRNVDNLTFDCGDGDGPQVYTAFYWDFGELDEQTDGSIPTWNVKVSNVNRAVESLLEEYGGGVGGSVTVYVVQKSRLLREPDLELDFDIVGSGSDAKLVTFKLGAESPFRIIFGRHPYASDTCNWRYMGPQCGYVGIPLSATTTSGSQNVPMPSVTGVSVGMLVSGPGIPPGTTVAGRPTTPTEPFGGGPEYYAVVLSQPATASGTVTLNFALPSCSLTLNGTLGCRAHGNQLRYGAFPGIDSNGLRAVNKG